MTKVISIEGMMCNHCTGTVQKAIADNITKADMLQRMSDTAYLKLIYRLIFGRKLDLKNPQTFNEKLQWLKLNDRKTEYTTMVDKYEVK